MQGMNEYELCVNFELILLYFDHRFSRKYNHFKERHRNPNVIVAQYIGTGNLVGQLSPGISIFLCTVLRWWLI